MKASRTLAALLLLVCVLQCSATDYIVGDSVGWSVGMKFEDWAKLQKFVVGDNLVFHYIPEQHTVTEVTKIHYETCSISNYIDTDASGTTMVTLDKPGTRYFICGLPDHCDAGMKITVKVGLPVGTPSSKTEFKPSSAFKTLTPSSGTVLLSAMVVLLKIRFF